MWRRVGVSRLSPDWQASMDLFLRDIRVPALKMTVLRVRDEELALDLLQEAMIGFVQAAARFDETLWQRLFFKILLRRITDWQRKKGWRDRIARIVPFSGLAGSSGDSDDVMVPEGEPEASAQEEHDADELAAALEQALGELPARQQEVWLLRQWQGLSVQETAAAMGCSAGTVKTHLSRAMQALRERLGEWVEE